MRWTVEAVVRLPSYSTLLPRAKDLKRGVKSADLNTWEIEPARQADLAACACRQDPLALSTPYAARELPVIDA